MAKDKKYKDEIIDMPEKTFLDKWGFEVGLAICTVSAVLVITSLFFLFT